MSQLQENLRFVHGSELLVKPKSQYSGFTIAYMRFEDSLKFSYSLCSKHDVYSKAVGREKSTETYKNLKKINFSALIENINENLDIPFISIYGKLRVGRIGIEHFKIPFRGINVFSDQMLNKLTMNDFKHVCISKVLSELLTGYIEN